MRSLKKGDKKARCGCEQAYQENREGSLGNTDTEGRGGGDKREAGGRASGR